MYIIITYNILKVLLALNINYINKVFRELKQFNKNIIKLLIYYLIQFSFNKPLFIFESYKIREIITFYYIYLYLLSPYTYYFNNYLLYINFIK